MKKLSNTDAHLEKTVTNKKNVYVNSSFAKSLLLIRSCPLHGSERKLTGAMNNMKKN